MTRAQRTVAIVENGVNFHPSEVVTTEEVLVAVLVVDDDALVALVELAAVVVGTDVHLYDPLRTSICAGVRRKSGHEALYRTGGWMVQASTVIAVQAGAAG